jgi:hypothetical protein
MKRFQIKVLAPINWGLQPSRPGNGGLIFWGLESPLSFEYVIKEKIQTGVIDLTLRAKKNILDHLSTGLIQLKLSEGRVENLYENP